MLSCNIKLFICLTTWLVKYYNGNIITWCSVMDLPCCVTLWNVYIVIIIFTIVYHFYWGVSRCNCNQCHFWKLSPTHGHIFGNPSNCELRAVAYFTFPVQSSILNYTCLCCGCNVLPVSNYIVISLTNGYQFKKLSIYLPISVTAGYEGFDKWSTLSDKQFMHD